MALSHCQRGLDIAKALSARSAETANAMNELGLVHLGLGDADAAMALFEGALDVARAVAPRNPQVVNALNNLAAAHRSLGETDLAEREAGRAREIEGGTVSPHGRAPSGFLVAAE
ncbi:MAG TPA: tetratricopeptide repeat protein [Acidimicrobiales bacterium]|nr:tetratricopeptide repeat protein [Acidimicrobiales bacterium]